MCSIFQYPTDDILKNFIICRVLENTMSGAQYFILSPWKSIEKYFVSGLVYNASLQKNDWCITLCLKKSIGKYHEGWWWSRGKILDFLPRSRRLRGRKSNIFPRDYHQPRVVFSNTFFQTKGNNNHFLWVMLYILSSRLTWTL